MMNKETRVAFFMAFVIALAATLPAGQPQGGNTGIARTAPSLPSSEIQSIARDLADKAQDVFNLASNARGGIPVELYVALCGFAGSAKAYSQMAGDLREEVGLRGAARRLVDQAREIDGLFGGVGGAGLQESWRLVRGQIARLSGAYSLGYSFRGGLRDPVARAPGPTAPGAMTGTTATPAPAATTATTSTAAATGGRFRWRGRVDGSDYISVRGNQVLISHIEAQPIRDASYELPVSLPQQPMQLKLTKLRGRGTVEIVRQPTAENKYTLVVLIEDPANGADLYEFEVAW